MNVRVPLPATVKDQIIDAFFKAKDMSVATFKFMFSVYAIPITDEFINNIVAIKQKKNGVFDRE